MGPRKYKNRTQKKGARRNKKSVSRKTRGGDCGCSKHVMGGSANLSTLDTQYYYPYNANLAADPQNPSAMIDETLAGDFSRFNNVAGGGKKRSRKSLRKKLRRSKRGGMNVFANAGYDTTTYSSFGQPNSGAVQANTVTGLGVLSSGSAMDQPVLTAPYGSHNPPLV
jgi:hypothetical protein